MYNVNVLVDLPTCRYVCTYMVRLIIQIKDPVRSQRLVLLHGNLGECVRCTTAFFNIVFWSHGLYCDMDCCTRNYHGSRRLEQDEAELLLVVVFVIR